MRVAYFIEDYGQISETFVTQLIHGLPSEDLNVRVFANKIHNNKVFNNPNSNLTVKETRFMELNKFSIILAVLYGRIIRDIFSLSNLQKKVAEKKLKKFIEDYNPSVAYIDFGNNSIIVRNILKDYKIPYVVHFHGRDASQLFGRKDYLHEIKIVYKEASRVIVASSHIKRRLILTGCPESKIVVVNLAFSSDKIPKCSWDYRKTIEPSILSIGRLVEKKNPIALLYAFKLVKAKIKNAKLTIVGGGCMEEEVRSVCNELKIADSVQLKGELPHYQALSEFRDNWIYALHCVTSSTGDQEGFNISIMEAGASGMPCVSTLHDGIPDHVINGETGFLVPEYNYNAMAEKMIELLSNPELCETMGMKAKKHYSTGYEVEKRVSKIRDILIKSGQNYG